MGPFHQVGSWREFGGEKYVLLWLTRQKIECYIYRTVVLKLQYTPESLGGFVNPQIAKPNLRASGQ